MELNVIEKTLKLSDGRLIQYKALLSTMPLDDTLQFVGMSCLADNLTHGSSHIVGVGIRGAW